MNPVISIFAATAGAEEVQRALTQIEKDVEILAQVMPVLCNDLAILLCRPFKLIWDPTIPTACTDCKAEVRLSPRFFLEGRREVGFGVAYHESGHILFSPRGTELLQQAHQQGGETRQHIMGILLDRKDDLLMAAHAPGFAETLRQRLTFICTMTRRERLADQIAAFEARMRKPAAKSSAKKKKVNDKSLSSDKLVDVLLGNWKPDNIWEDFFFTAKWHKSPRLPQTAKITKYIKSSRLRKAIPEELLWLAERIHKILGEMPEKRGSGEAGFNQLVRLANTLSAVCAFLGAAGTSQKLDQELAQALAAMMAQFVGSARKSGLDQLIDHLRSQGMVYPGPLSVGKKDSVPVKLIIPSATHAALYEQMRTEVAGYISTLVTKLRALDSPSEFTIYGQDEGELDLSEAARIATGLSGVYQQTILERDIDAEIHLAIDCSGSMSGDKIRKAKLLATIFSEGIRSLRPACEGRVWGYDSEAVWDCGELNDQSGFVALEGKGGNSDTHMLIAVGARLMRSLKRRKLLFVLGDDGPDNISEVQQLCGQLMARGVVVIHLLVDVHGTPNIFPFELVFSTIDECMEGFGDLFFTIMQNLR